MNKLFIAICIAGAFVCNLCMTVDSAPTSMQDQKPYQELSLMIRNCPLWFGLPSDAVDERKEITSRCIQMANYDDRAIRQAIDDVVNNYCQGFDDVYNRSRIYVFLRVAYNVPPGYIREGKAFGSWGNPYSNDCVNVLWPFDIAEDGRLILVGVSSSMYYGQMYDPIADYEYLKSEFGRRK
jgi:hypothetical protein